MSDTPQPQTQPDPVGSPSPPAPSAVCYEATPVRVPYDPAKLSRENGPLRVPRMVLLGFLSGDLGPDTVGEMRRAHRHWKRSDVRNMLVNGGDERDALLQLERAFERFIGLPSGVHAAEQDHQLQDDSHLLRHARAELTKAGLFDPDGDYAGEIGPGVLDLITELARGGHSGGSAAMVASLLQRLWAFKPLRPLTGAADEWHEVRRGDPDHQGIVLTRQNLRCCSVFQDTYADGTVKAHDIDGGVKIHPDGFRSSHPIPVTFPYMPADKPQEFWCDADGGNISNYPRAPVPATPGTVEVAVDFGAAEKALLESLQEQPKQVNPVSGLLTFQQARQWLLDTRDPLNRLNNGEHARSYGKEYEPVICHVDHIRRPMGLLSSHVNTLRLIEVFPDGSMLSYAQLDQAALDEWEQSSTRWVTTYLGCVLEAVKHADEVGVLLHKSFKTPSVATMEAVRLLSLRAKPESGPLTADELAKVPEQQASHPVWATRAKVPQETTETPAQVQAAAYDKGVAEGRAAGKAAALLAVGAALHEANLDDAVTELSSHEGVAELLTPESVQAIAAGYEAARRDTELAASSKQRGIPARHMPRR